MSRSASILSYIYLLYRSVDCFFSVLIYLALFHSYRFLCRHFDEEFFCDRSFLLEIDMGKWAVKFFQCK